MTWHLVWTENQSSFKGCVNGCLMLQSSYLLLIPHVGQLTLYLSYNLFANLGISLNHFLHTKPEESFTPGTLWGRHTNLIDRQLSLSQPWVTGPEEQPVDPSQLYKRCPLCHWQHSTVCQFDLNFSIFLFKAVAWASMSILNVKKYDWQVSVL